MKASRTLRNRCPSCAHRERPGEIRAVLILRTGRNEDDERIFRRRQHLIDGTSDAGGEEWPLTWKLLLQQSADVTVYR